MRTLLWGILFLMPCLAHSIENLGDGCEWLLKNSTELRAGLRPVKLADDEVLVRGHLLPHVEQGFEGMVIFSVFDRQFEDKVIQNPYLAMYPLKHNDHVVIMNEKKQTMAHGYYREQKVEEVRVLNNRSYLIRTNQPALYTEPDGTELALPLDKLADYFIRKADSYVVRKVSSEERKKMQDEYRPVFKAANSHLLSPNRFYKLNDEITLEIAHFEKVLDGTFGFGYTTETEYFLPNTQSLPEGVCFVPRFFDTETGEEKNLGFNDRIMILNASNKVIYSAMIRTIINGKPVLPTGDMVKLVERLRKGERIVAVRVDPIIIKK